MYRMHLNAAELVQIGFLEVNINVWHINWLWEAPRNTVHLQTDSKYCNMCILTR